MRLEQLITGNDAVQQHVASEREKQALVPVAPAARSAIKLEILPQIEESVISVESAEELCAETKRAIEAAFSYKNQLYTRLVSHKGIEQGDSLYLKDLLIVMDEWLRTTKASLERGTDKEPSKDDKQEVEVTVKVDGDVAQAKPEPEPEPEPKSEPEIVIRQTEDGPRIEVDPDALFDFMDMRL